MTIDTLTNEQAGRCHKAGLTPAETEQLALLAQGLSTRQIAERQVVALQTAANRSTTIYEKLHLSSGNLSVQAALWFHGIEART